MDIVYVADTQIPSRATNGMQVMRMCSAFAANGIDVTLVHPHRFGNTPEGFDGDVWAFYGAAETFRRVTLPTLLTLRLSGFHRFARIARAIPLASWLTARSRPGAAPFAVYSRSMVGAWLALRIRRLWGHRSACRRVFVELHDVPQVGARKVLLAADGLVVISEALRRHLVEVGVGAADHALVEHDGVDLGTTCRIENREAVRRRFGLTEDVTVLGYTGRVNAEKGVGTLLEAARTLQGSPVHFLVVGKRYASYAEPTHSNPANVTMTGFVPPSQVPDYVAASDILVMPTSASLPYAQFTSPLKLFEYMASGRPIICSDLPVLREVLRDGENAMLVAPDDSDEFVAAVQRLLAEPARRQALAAQALRDVTRYAWNERAARIVNWMNPAGY
jgi:glycosyltransferase involved in cell wall biosynthesis